MDAGSTLSGRKHYSQLAEINVTSLVDVTLVLLIVFMLTAPFIQGGVDVDLPTTHSVQEVAQEGIVISLDKERRVYVDDDPVPLSQLAELLRSSHPQSDTRPVYLRSDQAVPYGFVVRVMGEIKSAGVETLSLVVEPETES
jgi:biopolymer transport protein TolR